MYLHISINTKFVHDTIIRSMDYVATPLLLNQPSYTSKTNRWAFGKRNIFSVNPFSCHCAQDQERQ